MEMNPLYYLNRQRIDLGTFYVHLMHGMFCPECGPFKPPFFDIRTPICEHYARDVTNTLYPNKHLYFLKINLRKLRLIGFPDPMESPSYLHNSTLLDRYSNISQIVNAPIINIPKPRKLPSTNPLLQSAQIYPQQHKVRVDEGLPEGLRGVEKSTFRQNCPCAVRTAPTHKAVRRPWTGGHRLNGSSTTQGGRQPRLEDCAPQEPQPHRIREELQ